MLYLVCYDVSDDKRRTNIAKILLAYGDRVQYSVFEVMIQSKSQFNALCEQLQKIVDEEQDADVRLYPLCGQCGAAVSLKGDSIADIPAVIIL